MLLPASLTLPSVPIPISPAYTSVKVPAIDLLAKDKRLDSGVKVYEGEHG
ncbi:hypothetical protein [Parapedobacter defluvii]